MHYSFFPLYDSYISTFFTYFRDHQHGVELTALPVTTDQDIHTNIRTRGELQTDLDLHTLILDCSSVYYIDSSGSTVLSDVSVHMHASAGAKSFLIYITSQCISNLRF